MSTNQPPRRQSINKQAAVVSNPELEQASEILEEVQSFKPFEQGKQEIELQRFKLLVAKMRKNHGVDGDDPLWLDHEHTHMFYSVDTHGNPQDYSTAIGGHFHEVKFAQDENGNVSISYMSPPLRWEKQTRGRRSMRVAVELNEDKHTHKVEYHGFKKLNLKQINTEYVKFQSMLDSKKPGPVEGVR